MANRATITVRLNLVHRFFSRPARFVGPRFSSSEACGWNLDCVTLLWEFLRPCLSVMILIGVNFVSAGADLTFDRRLFVSGSFNLLLTVIACALKRLCLLTLIWSGVCWLNLTLLVGFSLMVRSPFRVGWCRFSVDLCVNFCL